MLQETKQATRLAAATVLLNIAATQHKSPGLGGAWNAACCELAVTILLKYMSPTEDHDVVYRAIVASGTLAISGAEVTS